MMVKDSQGFAPEATHQCDTHDDCLGWILCSHAGTGRDEDGWCTECDSPAIPGELTWTWCPEREN